MTFFDFTWKSIGSTGDLVVSISKIPWSNGKDFGCKPQDFSNSATKTTITVVKITMKTILKKKVEVHRVLYQWSDDILCKHHSYR